ncbi:MAG TPA: N-formylglutamate amidohydrolase, partial [Paracoccaceae bacterium]|nr:N-formylglutamate amidohydrolase [Paracoccaceae bacterium]
HSIRSHIPYLFHGTLPDFNVGTNSGTSCSQIIEETVYGHCVASDDYTHVLNGRFKGGWTTRHYGDPARGVHAIQMELAQSTYLAAEAPPWDFDGAKADRLRPLLARLLADLEDLALEGRLA